MSDNGLDLKHVSELCERIKVAVTSYEPIHNPGSARTLPASANWPPRWSPSAIPWRRSKSAIACT